MGVRDWFRKQLANHHVTNQRAASSAPQPRRPGGDLPPAYLALIESTRRPYAAIELGDGTAPDPRASKLGGVPYRPIGGPHDALLARDELSFIAQVRCAELPELPDFPRDGILQFWIARRDLFDGVGERADGRVCLYYPSLDAPQLDGWAPSDDAEASPLDDVTRARPLRLVAATACMPAGDYQWRALLEEAGLGASHEDLFELDLDRYEASGDHVGGYCAFTQDDPRAPGDPMTSLLQLDSGDAIQWGDTGIGHWFLRPADLRARAFDKTLFYWDCC